MSEFIGKKQTNNKISMAEASRTERNKDKIQFIVASCKKKETAEEMKIKSNFNCLEEEPLLTFSL